MSMLDGYGGMDYGMDYGIKIYYFIAIPDSTV